jgi:hypothetical protein
MTYTHAQLAAFASLPARGEWAGPWLNATENLEQLPWTMIQWKGGRSWERRQCRLTAAGIAERKRLVAEGLIE